MKVVLHVVGVVDDTIMMNLAQQNHWVVRYDHCFQRIILDTLFGACWYDKVKQRPAYKQLSSEQLQQALRIARDIERDGDEYLRQLNVQSLQWRNKL